MSDAVAIEFRRFASHLDAREELMEVRRSQRRAYPWARRG